MPLLIILGIILIIVIISSIFNNKAKESAFLEFQTKVKELGYKIENVQNECFDLKISNVELTFLVKLISIPQYAEIQINNNVTWEIKYGAGNTPGKQQPYSKYLKEIIPFVKHEKNDNEIKVVIASPSPKKIVKWINECEIIFVDPYTDVYGVRVISYKDLRLFKNPHNIKEQDLI